jgi:hypothetical protein
MGSLPSGQLRDEDPALAPKIQTSDSVSINSAMQTLDFLQTIRQVDTVVREYIKQTGVGELHPVFPDQLHYL